MKLRAPGPDTTWIGGEPFEWGRRTYVMGVVNVTPDSFSGDGVGRDVDAAVKLALNFQEWGADIVDVGGESTRPASIYSESRPASVEEELERVGSFSHSAVMIASPLALMLPTTQHDCLPEPFASL